MASALLAVVCSGACRRNSEDRASARRVRPAASKPAGPPPSARQGTTVARSLLEEAARAELRSSGVAINLGTPDQHKYTLGGFATGWNDPASRGAPCLGARRSADLLVELLDGGADTVRLRARSALPGQAVSLEIDGRQLEGSARLGGEWTIVELSTGAPLARGPHRVGLRFARGKGRAATVAHVDWVWVCRGCQGATPPSPRKVATRDHGGPRRALVADAPRTLSYHLQVPGEARLVFDSAGPAGVRFRVRVSADGAPGKTVFDRTVEGPARWREGNVDLGAWAGKVVRLDLVTSGPAGAASWGEPDVVRTGARPEAAADGSRQARNLIYILIDTARQDVYRPFNDETHVHAPAMAALARESTIFTNAYANSNWTKPSIATIWSGLYPSTHGTKSKSSRLPRQVPVYSEHLRRHGFTTAAFIANGYTSGKFGFKRGWDSYRNYIREDLPYKAERVYGDALAWLREHREQRFFLYLQTIDPHVPYEAPAKHLARYYEGRYSGPLGPTVTGYETRDFNEGRKRFSADDRRYTRAHYDGEISYHDLHMGRFLDQLRELGLLGDTLLVVSNDHGEELLDHGAYGHGHSLYEELIRAPLVVHYPPLFPAGKTVDHVVELVDLLPTQLEVLGVPPMKGVEGLSLLGAVHGRPATLPGYAVAEYMQKGRAVRVGPYKQITWAGGEQLLFDLARDPAEKDDLSASHPVARRLCEILLGEGLGTPNKAQRLRRLHTGRRYRSTDATIDGALRRQLRALGYIN